VLMGDGKIRCGMAALERIAGFEGIKEIPLHGATSSWSLIKYIIISYILIPYEKLCEKQWMNKICRFVIILRIGLIGESPSSCGM